jgi:citrate lyase subunit beta/citryl-CoA lyase
MTQLTTTPGQGRGRALRRSKLICMGDNLEAMTAGPTSGADIIQVVLEDGVDDTHKDLGLQRTLELLAADCHGAERWVKVNTLSSGRIEEDVDAVVSAGAEAIIMPKIETPDDVLYLANFVDAVEKKHDIPAGSVRIVCSIERIRALHNVEAIAACHPRILALQLGLFDLGEEFGYKLDYTGPSYETLYAKSRSILAAKLARIEIGDWPYPVMNDLIGTQQSTLRSIQLGFTHKACYERDQIAVINQLFDMASDLSAKNEYVSAKAEQGLHGD